MDAAIAKLDDALGVLRNVRLMRDDDDRQVPLTIEPLKNFHHFDGRARIERAGRLIRQNERRIVHQRARQSDTLLLASRQLIRHVALAVGKTDFRQRRARSARALACADAGIDQRQFDVLERGSSRNKIEALEDKADILIPNVREPGLSTVETSTPSRKYCPFVGRSRQPMMFIIVDFPNRTDP